MFSGSLSTEGIGVMDSNVVTRYVVPFDLQAIATLKHYFAVNLEILDGELIWKVCEVLCDSEPKASAVRYHFGSFSNLPR